MFWIEATAVAFGLLCVSLTVRQSVWCWPTGLVQVSLYIIIFYDAKLYSDLILHVIYVGVQFYGWHHWLHGGREGGQLAASRLTPTALGTWVAVVAAGTFLWGSGMAAWTDAALPYGDAFTTVASLVAQWLMAQKKIENWFFWIAVDVIAVGIYFLKSLFLTTGLYTVFLFLCVLGYMEWRKSLAGSAADLSAIPMPE